MQRESYDVKSDLYRAIERGDTDSALKLITAGDNPNQGCTYYSGFRSGTQSNLCLAIKKGQNKVALELIEKGADLDAGYKDSDGDCTPNLYYAIACNHIEVVRALIAAGADIDKDSVSPLNTYNTCQSSLEYAINKGLIDAALVLIENGAQLSVTAYNLGIQYPEIAKALFQRLYQGECFPSLSALSMFSLSGLTDHERIPPRVVAQYNSYAKDMEFLREYDTELNFPSKRVISACGFSRNVLSILFRCAASEGARSQYRAPGR